MENQGGGGELWKQYVALKGVTEKAIFFEGYVEGGGDEIQSAIKHFLTFLQILTASFFAFHPLKISYNFFMSTKFKLDYVCKKISEHLNIPNIKFFSIF